MKTSSPKTWEELPIRYITLLLTLRPNCFFIFPWGWGAGMVWINYLYGCICDFTRFMSNLPFQDRVTAWWLGNSRASRTKHPCWVSPVHVFWRAPSSLSHPLSLYPFLFSPLHLSFFSSLKFFLSTLLLSVSRSLSSSVSLSFSLSIILSLSLCVLWPFLMRGGVFGV